MSEPFVGEIRVFAFSFAPTGWALCNGQLLPIQQNAALFSILGTTFGGDGRTNFALPNLQGNVVVDAGAGAGLTPRAPGSAGGTTAETITTQTMPSHTHPANCNSGNGNQVAPGGNFWAAETGGTSVYSGSANAQMAAGALGTTGGAQSHSNLQPYLVLNYCIALQGIYPSRN